MKLPTIYAQKLRKAQLDLSLSENPLGCSRRVLGALRKLTVSDVNKYPDTEALIQAIAEKWRVEPENVLLGCGSEQLIKLIAQTVLLPGDMAVIQNASFAVFLRECLLARANCTLVDIAKIERESNAKLAFLCNPNNPTGECISQKTLGNIVARLSKTTVVIDEANGEFMDDSFIPQTVQTKNTLVLRTLSKAIGLAGLRVGFAIGPVNLISKLKQAQQPFPISSLACKLAVVALGDTSFISETRQFMESERVFLQKELTTRGLQCSNSITNTMLVTTPQAQFILKKFKQMDVGVVDAKLFPGLTIPGFRISIKDFATNRMFLQKLDKALSCLPKGKLLRSKGDL